MPEAVAAALPALPAENDGNHVGDVHDKADETCHLLKLPPELRNQIYDSAFHVSPDSDGFVYFTTKPPAKDVLMTCRQIYNEAKGWYKHAYRRFWSEGHFMIRRGSRSEIYSMLPGIRDLDIAAVTKVTIDVFFNYEIAYHEKAQLVDGVWISYCGYPGRVKESGRDIVISKDRRIADARGFSIAWINRNFHVLDADRIPEDQLPAAFEVAGRKHLTAHEILGWLDFFCQ